MPLPASHMVWLCRSFQVGNNSTQDIEDSLFSSLQWCCSEILCHFWFFFILCKNSASTPGVCTLSSLSPVLWNFTVSTWASLIIKLILSRALQLPTLMSDGSGTFLELYLWLPPLCVIFSFLSSSHLVILDFLFCSPFCHPLALVSRNFFTMYSLYTVFHFCSHSFAFQRAFIHSLCSFQVSPSSRFSTAPSSLSLGVLPVVCFWSVLLT